METHWSTSMTSSQFMRKACAQSDWTAWNQPQAGWYKEIGKDYVRDANGNTNVRLVYAYDSPPHETRKQRTLLPNKSYVPPVEMISHLERHPLTGQDNSPDSVLRST